MKSEYTNFQYRKINETFKSAWPAGFEYRNCCIANEVGNRMKRNNSPRQEHPREYVNVLNPVKANYEDEDINDSFGEDVYANFAGQYLTDTTSDSYVRFRVKTTRPISKSKVYMNDFFLYI